MDISKITSPQLCSKEFFPKSLLIIASFFLTLLVFTTEIGHWILIFAIVIPFNQWRKESYSVSCWKICENQRGWCEAKHLCIYFFPGVCNCLSFSMFFFLLMSSCWIITMTVRLSPSHLDHTYRLQRLLSASASVHVLQPHWPSSSVSVMFLPGDACLHWSFCPGCSSLPHPCITSQRYLLREAFKLKAGLSRSLTVLCSHPYTAWTTIEYFCDSFNFLSVTKCNLQEIRDHFNCDHHCILNITWHTESA